MFFNPLSNTAFFTDKYSIGEMCLVLQASWEGKCCRPFGFYISPLQPCNKDKRNAKGIDHVLEVIERDDSRNGRDTENKEQAFVFLVSSALARRLLRKSAKNFEKYPIHHKL